MVQPFEQNRCFTSGTKSTAKACRYFYWFHILVHYSHYINSLFTYLKEQVRCDLKRLNTGFWYLSDCLSYNQSWWTFICFFPLKNESSRFSLNWALGTNGLIYSQREIPCPVWKKQTIDISSYWITSIRTR